MSSVETSEQTLRDGLTHKEKVQGFLAAVLDSEVNVDIETSAEADATE